MAKKISIKVLLDTRVIKKDGTASICLGVYYNNTSTTISTGVSVLPDQWDAKKKEIIKHPKKAVLNPMIRRMQSQYEGAVFDLVSTGVKIPGNAAGVKKLLQASINGDDTAPKYSLQSAMDKYVKDCTNGRTSQIYKSTISLLGRYIDLASVMLDDIGKAWITQVDKLVAQTAPAEASRALHLRNIRSCVNYAIDLGWTNNYPFRRYKLPSAPTRKRSISVEALRTIITLDLDPILSYHRDMFLLTFGLIGINTIDLYNLAKIDDGRAEYVRAKTKKSYSIKVEPEMQAIIDRHAGANTAVDIADRHKGDRWFSSNTNKRLKAIGAMLYIDEQGVERPICPDLSPYWARHSWATIAASLDIPKDVIAAALGHGGNTVTDIYIDFDLRKVDEANRKVLDWVYYGLR